MTNYNQLSTYKKEDYLEIEILKYLQKIQQPVTRSQIINYLITNVDNIPNDALKSVISKRTGRPYQPFKNRISFALTSLYKARLIDHHKRGITELNVLGKKTDPNNTKYIHDLVMKGWNKEHETTRPTH